MNIIPYGKQEITEEDIQSVVEILKSDYLTQGPAVARFEQAFSNYIGSKYSVAVSNGTTALHLSALVAGATKGKKIIVPPITFSASANCILYCGGEVEFVDIDPQTYCLDIKKVQALLESHPRGTFSGIIPVDMAGYPVNLEEFYHLSKQHDLWIIEDSCHAPGAEYFSIRTNQWEKSGSSKFSDMSIFSFHPVKHIACGEGGMITTNNRTYYEKLLLLRTHGINKNPQELSEFPGEWFAEMQVLGFNYRLPDMLCALGASQISRANKNLQKRREIAKIYDEELKQLPITLPFRNPEIKHAFHLYVILTDRRKELYDFLKRNSIHAQVHYIPIPSFPYYKNLGYSMENLPVAKNYYERCLSLPMYHGLKASEQEYVIAKIKEFFKGQ